MVSLVIIVVCRWLGRTNYTAECCGIPPQGRSTILPGPTQTSRMHAGLHSSSSKVAEDTVHSTRREKAQTKDIACCRPAEEQA
jgi:hypothetical protein